MTMEAETYEIAGRLYENAVSLRLRLKVSDLTLRRLVERGMPAPIMMARKRLFDRDKVDAWLIGGAQPNSTSDSTTSTALNV